MPILPGLRAEALPLPAGPGRAEIWVRDNGAGMSGPVQRKLFRPFRTTKPAGEGTGLGLSMGFGINN